MGQKSTGATPWSRNASLCVLSFMISGVCAPVMAQDMPRAGADASPGRVEDYDAIVVTARRRAERLQDVPQAVLAFSNEALERANVAQIADIVRIAPGLVYQPSALGNKSLSLTLRSQRQNLPNITFDPSVVVYFAEVPNMRMLGANAALYDLSSVQVLKGPQGTLFGRNSTGGALLVTPQAPTQELGGYIKAGFGNYAAFEVEGAINLPISTTLQLRLAGRHDQRDGFEQVIGRDYAVNDDNNDGLRASLRFSPTDGFTNDLVFDYAKQSGSGTAYVIGVCNPAGRANTLYQMCADLPRQQAAPFHSTTSNVDPKGTKIETWAVSNISTAELDTITLKNIIGYRKTKSFFPFDIDGSSKDVLSGSSSMNVRQITDEVQIIGKAFGDSLVYQLGAFIFDESGRELQQTSTLGSNSYSELEASNQSYSLFGQATYKLPWIDGLSVTAGLRQTWDKRQMTNRGRTITSALNVCRILNANTGGVPLNPCEKAVSASFDALTYNFSVDWKAARGLLVYAATRKGYRSGGFLNSPRIPSEFEPFRPETITDYELGVKADYKLGDVVGRTNVALYTGNYDDIQRTITVSGIFDPVTNSFYNRNSILNAGKARISGVEIEQMWRPFPFLEINASYAYSKAKYTSFILPDGRDFTKAPFAGAPKHTVSGSIRLELPISERAGQFAAQLSGSYRSDTIMADLTSFDLVTQSVFSTSKLKGYGTLDARVEWLEVLGNKLTLSAFVRNLTDNEYYTAGQDVTAVGFTSFILGAPRTYGFQARFEF
ncbi:TonB-dependent receptor [soil metagenome]